MKRLAALVVSLGIMSAPAQAQWVVTDPGSYVRMWTQLQNDISILKAAQQELTQLPSSLFSATNMSSYLTRSANVLAQSQAACKANPARCSSQARVAVAQAPMLQRILTNLQSLRAASQGSPGQVAATQAVAAATINLAEQNAAIIQRNAAIDDDQAAANAEVYGVPRQ